MRKCIDCMLISIIDYKGEKMTQAELFKSWTKQALADKDGQGKTITNTVVTKGTVELPKDEYGQVIVGNGVDTDSGLAKPRQGLPHDPKIVLKGYFDQPVINAMTGF